MLLDPDNPRTLKVLIADDHPADADLILDHLHRSGYRVQAHVVDTEVAYLRALSPELDLILADYTMTNFSGLRALQLLLNRRFEVPFLIVSGTIGEDLAVEAMRLGALDCVLKSQLTRLGSAVSRALSLGRLRRERQLALEALRLFRVLVDQSADSFEVLDAATGRFVDISEGGCRELGYTREELVEMNVSDVDPNAAAIWPEFVQRLRSEGGIAGEGTHRRKDGSVFPIEYNARLVRVDREYVVSVVRNVTERHEAAAALRASEGRFANAMQALMEGCQIIGRDWRYLFVNEVAARQGRRTVAELVGRTVTEAYPGIEHSEMFAVLRQCMADGQARHVETEFREGGGSAWFQLVVQPVPEGLFVISLDVTERRKLEEQFLRAQRLEAIGTLAGGVAHDLNNILAPVLMVSGLLRSRLSSEADRNALALVESSAMRGASIVRQLLMFSRGVTGERVLVQLRHLIREMSNIMAETFPREITIGGRVPNDLWPVMGDATQLHQVMMNLCVNARDAMGAGGTLSLSGHNALLTEDEARYHAGAHAGRYTVVTVEDTGVGIAADIIDRIFDPFFTTKELGKGSGLGLSTVLGIVKSHGGFVAVESQPGRGATFRVFLPAADSAVPAVLMEGPGSVPRGRNETVLVVDDEEHVKQMSTLVLEEHGYRVVTAGHGKEAVMRFLENQDSVRVVLTDLMMPVMGGFALIKALRGIKPDLPVIATTGLDPEVRRAELAELGITEVLLKPCEPQKLLAAIRRMLDVKPVV